MTSTSDEADAWSDDIAEDERAGVTPIHSRAYQVEMFEQSMQNNIIAVMATGSGKTQIAKLRIEAELERTVGKRIWFTTPSVVLAYQQHSFLSQQLPAAQFKLITGMNSPEYWKSQQIWDQALFNVEVVVCTPQILLDALDYGFVSFSDVSLIVIDEAHHCYANNPLNTMMKNHYHPFSNGESSLPAILGLSASPVTKKSIDELRKLEENLAATCVTPTQQMDEYTSFVNAPEFQVVTYLQKPHDLPPILMALETIVNSLTIDEDPYVQKLRCRKDLASQQKLDKIMQKDKTPAMEEVQSFLRSAIDLQETLGPWAAREYIRDCLRAIQMQSYKSLQSGKSSEGDTLQFICRTLEPLYATRLETCADPVDSNDFSEKVGALIKLLVSEYQPATRAMIFIKTRSSAWALTKFLQAHTQTRQYHPFAFVGCSNPSYRSVFESADPFAQNQALEDFRRGELNLCVATSVMEEGIDVPALNIVICFDEPSNVRGFVQSRGRARQQKSKFIIFKKLGDEVASKLGKWEAVEEEMKLACARDEKEREERRIRESQEETGGEIFRVPTTGAALTYENSQQRLQRFCAKASGHVESAKANPVYVVSGDMAMGVRATAHLPCTIDPALRIFHSKMAWRTERMARRDAAFQAYLSLYKAGLVTDNLLPPDIPKKDTLRNEEDRNIEKRDGFYPVTSQYDPWPGVMQLITTDTALYSHEIRATSSGNNFPTMELLLPLKLNQCSFSLFESSSERIEVSLGSGRPFPQSFVQISRTISFYLLSTVLGRRMQGTEADQVPLIIIPSIGPEMLQGWYDQSIRSLPFVEYMSKGGPYSEELLLKVANSNIPYVHRPHPSEGAAPHTTTMTIHAKRLPRRLDYLSPQDSLEQNTVASQESLAVAQCEVLGLPAEHGRFMLLIPSITHMFEVFLRSTEASIGPLSTLSLQSLNLVSEALTTPAVSKKNYQRLEFLGDELLKYYASTQVFVDHTNHPEGLLTIYTGRIVANSRLQRATRELGLDKFLTRVKFAGQDWRAGVDTKKGGQEAQGATEHLSSKVLADVIEALIGAAYVDGTKQGRSEETVISALKLFIDEISWNTPAENIARLPVDKSTGIVTKEKLLPVEEMIGYQFKQSRLLTEALTHSSYNPSISSYDRLEFLGDAVLDHLVKIRLYQNDELLSPEEMTLRRHALVSHAALSFFALQASHVATTVEIETDLASKKQIATEVHRTVYLADHIRQIDSRDLSQARKKTLSTWKEVQPAILQAFEHGKTFPWDKLLSLDAPKSYSDIIESILGAVFVDSGANLGACEQFLEKIGYMKLVSRVTNAQKGGEIQTIHPEAALANLATKFQMVAQKTAQSGWRCKVLVGGEHVAHALRASSRDEARCRAAKRAVRILTTKKKRKIEALEADHRGGEEGRVC